jgi:hypothetical protein
MNMIELTLTYIAVIAEKWNRSRDLILPTFILLRSEGDSETRDEPSIRIGCYDFLNFIFKNMERKNERLQLK